MQVQLCQLIDQLSATHGLIHGDFSADQVIVDEQNATIIDWDRAAMGDQGADLGSLLAGLDRQALAGRITFAEAALCRENFLAGYRRTRPVPLSVHTQTLVHLGKLLTEPFRQRAADWDRQTVMLIDRLEAELDAAGPNGGGRYADLLARALDRDHMSPRIAAWTGSPLVATPELVRLKPGRRALISYDVVDANGAECRYLGKLRFSRPDRKTPARHARLRRAGLDERSDTAVPRAIVPDDLMPIWLMEQVPGRRLADLMSPECGLVPFRQTGQALARLHGSGVWTEAVWSYADEIAVLDKALAKASEGCPALASRLAELRADANLLATRLAPVPNVLLHRDFYFDQLLIDGERVWLLDLDCAALGDPAVDLGNFLAHLIEYGMRRFGDGRALQRHMDSFIDGYAKVREPGDSDRIEILTLISLCRHVNICRDFPDRAHLQGALLEFCRDMANRLKQV
jgi:aminoglycoside phosphotransferase (APT) family kinase protein